MESLQLHPDTFCLLGRERELGSPPAKIPDIAGALTPPFFKPRACGLSRAVNFQLGKRVPLCETTACNLLSPSLMRRNNISLFEECFGGLCVQVPSFQCTAQLGVLAKGFLKAHSGRRIATRDPLQLSRMRWQGSPKHQFGPHLGKKCKHLIIFHRVVPLINLFHLMAH